MGMGRRDFLALGAAWAALAAALPGEAEAGEGVSICLYSRGLVARRARFRPASARAGSIVAEIRRRIGYTGRIEVYESPSISNAGAVPGRRGRPHLILYNADFMNRLDSLHPAAPVGVLAHEVGHFTGPAQSARTSWQRELTADHAGGCIMHRLGADEAAATIALRALRGGASRTHPHPGTRVRAASDGWRSCRG